MIGAIESITTIAKSISLCRALTSIYYSDTPKFVPRKLHQAENFVDHLIL